MASKHTAKPTAFKTAPMTIINRHRSLAAKKAAVTRASNREQAARRSLRLHHTFVAGGAILVVLVVTFIGICMQLETYAASNSTGTFVGIGDKCLDNSGSRLTDNNKVQLYQCNGTSAQKWVHTSAGSLRANNGSSYCLDVPGNSKAEYTYLRLWKCNGSGAQHFTIVEDKIVGQATGFCATVHYAEITNGTPLWMKSCHGSTAQKWTYSGVAPTPSPIPSPNPSPTPTPSPTPGPTPGPSASYNFNSTIGALPAPTNLTLKNGYYTVSDFAYAGNYGVYSNRIKGIVGAGVTSSVIQMNQMTSSKAGTIPTASGTTNQYDLVRLDGTQKLSDFTIQGTNQGHLYNGLLLYYSSGSMLSNLKIAAIPGNNHFPPGETFSINDFHGNNNVYNNVEVDGAGVGASGFGLNSSSGGTWNNSYSHNNKYSIGWAFWQHTNGATINNSNSSNNHSGVNFERATGTYYLNNMTFGGNQDADISGGQDQSGYFKVIVKDPVLLYGQTKLKVHWFTSEAGVPSKYGKSNIQVIVQGVDKTDSMIQWH